MAPAPLSRLLGAPWMARAGMVLLTLPFWASGIGKLFDLDGALAEAAHFGLEPAWAVAAATILVQVGGSLALILGWQGWLGAGGLGVFTAVATLLAHPFWQAADPVARFHERNTVLEHAGLIGGLVRDAVVSQDKENQDRERT